MRVLITGACGFVGSTLARELRAGWTSDGLELVGIDNLSRAGSEVNRQELRRLGVNLRHGDLRLASDLEAIGDLDWVLDAAALPSVLAGLSDESTSRQVVEHNLGGTLNVLELCKARSAGLILLSTSRVYSIAALAAIRVEAREGAFVPRPGAAQPVGCSELGIDESFPTSAPVSLYGATKLASEQLALEYGAAFDFPVWIDRCGVLAGAGQFGRIDQGILSFWIHRWRRGLPLRYLGFAGQGHQVRDFLHPRDLVPLLRAQMDRAAEAREPIVNLGGGIESSFSLAQLSAWCAGRFGARPVAADLASRRYDAPWIVMDSRRAARLWSWRVETPLAEILREIADHAEAHPEWLEISG